MNRRAFLSALSGSLLAAPLAVEAQPAGRVYRIGFLRAGRPPDGFVAGFKQGLQELGYVEGRNIIIEYRFTDGSVEQLPGLVEELIRLKVDLILASAAPPALAAQKMTRTLPIIFVGVIDPEERGIVSGLARPGGNTTGLTSHAADLNGKRLGILKELLPGLERVAVFWNPANPTNQTQLTNTEAAARKLGVQVQPLPINNPDDFEPAFKAARGAGALLQLDGPFLLTHRTRLVELAKRSRLPGIYGFKEVVEVGGLMSYGAHYKELYRRAATYVDKILKGTKPGDLPVEQPTKFELVINLKTAKALGLTIPPSLLQRADQVIE
jgi:putative ABC transport system substrate-binding protein